MASSQDDWTCQIPLMSVSLAPVNLFHNNSRHKTEVTVIFTLLGTVWLLVLSLSSVCCSQSLFDVYDESYVSV